MDFRIGNKYRLGKKIGYGSFGQIYIGTNILNGEQVAIKLENSNTKRPQLLMESRFYKIAKGTNGFPSLKWFGKEENYNVMVFDLLGPSLEDLLEYCGNKFTLKTTLMLGQQMLNRIEFIHSKLYIHRDIKPENFLMGIGENCKTVYLVDFGLAKTYKDFQTNQHIPYKEGKNLTGTARYASISTHQGIEQSRRDDLESLGYVIIYFLRGNLPWQGVKGITRQQKYDKIAEKKTSCSIDDLCANQPKQLAIYLKYCRALNFEQKPDYKYLRKLLHVIFQESDYRYDKIYDWTVQNYKLSLQEKMKITDDTNEVSDINNNILCIPHCSKN